MDQNFKRQFLERGFVVIPGLISKAEAAHYVSRLDVLAGEQKQKWTLPNGVCLNEDFWPLVFERRLLDLVREVLGPEIRYLPHNDLHVGFSSFGWHRDNVNRKFGLGTDWNESVEPYRIARAGIYLHERSEKPFRLGLIGGSHRPDLWLTSAEHARIRRRTGAVASVYSWLSGTEPAVTQAEWVSTGPGDCIIFDPRILHTGSSFRGSKYSVFMAYGIESQHFTNHWQYYMNLRKDLGYSQIPDALASQLQAAELLARPFDAISEIDGAWIPSSSYTRVARYFK